MSWIIICKSCVDCGGDIGFRIIDNTPTEDDIKAVKDELGGMYCIKEYIKEIEEDNINIINPD